MSSKSDELLSMFDDYNNTIEGASTGVSSKKKKSSELWDDSFEFLWPELPENCVGTKLVSDLLMVTASQLPGPDFEMPVFDRDTSWPEEASVHIPFPDEEDIEHYVIPIEAGYWFCYGLRVNKPVFLSGVKGCGKSTLPKRICSLLNWPFVRKQMAKDLDSSEFFGQWVAHDGSTEFVLGDLPQAAILGMVFLVDEISNAPPELHPSLHWTLEKGGSIYLNSKDGDIKDKIIHPKDTFRIVASDNTCGQGDSKGHYAGTDVMNSATMDRFRVMIVMDYMSKGQEKRVLMDTVPGCTDMLASKMIDVAIRTRAAYAAGDLSETLSMRPLIEWAEKAVLTRDILSSLQLTLLNKIDSESERLEIKTYVQTVFGSLLSK
jgi:cobaltochelatase CobS